MAPETVDIRLAPIDQAWPAIGQNRPLDSLPTLDIRTYWVCHFVTNGSTRGANAVLYLF